MTNKKKIALLTCHRDPNYGSMLQAYALIAAIKKLGKQAEYLDYYTIQEPPSGLKLLLKNIRNLTYRFLKGLTITHSNKTRKSEFYFISESWFRPTMMAFQRFHDQYIPTSSSKYYTNTIRQKLDINEYDSFIVGSDQVWSPNLYNPKKPYFLDFADIPSKSAYAPSLGTTDISDDYIQLIKNKLSSFGHLSCREKKNCETLSRVLGREVTYVLDPTLLLDADEWNKVAKEPHNKGHYILAYILGEKDKIIEFAEHLGKAKSLPVYYIVTRPKYREKRHALLGLGPEDFIGYIKCADYVVTDSFHGCLFCINYRKNFYAFSKRKGDINNQDNVRILEFLKMLGLQERFQAEENAALLPDIQYKQVFNILQLLRISSTEYLNKCISVPLKSGRS